MKKLNCLLFPLLAGTAVAGNIFSLMTLIYSFLSASWQNSVWRQNVQREVSPRHKHVLPQAIKLQYVSKKAELTASISFLHACYSF